MNTFYNLQHEGNFMRNFYKSLPKPKGLTLHKLINIRGCHEQMSVKFLANYHKENVNSLRRVNKKISHPSKITF